MPYREYTLEDGTVLYIEVDETLEANALIDNATTKREISIIKAPSHKTGVVLGFEEALASIKKSMLAMKAAFEAARADEVTVTFRLKASGEMGGAFVVAKSGVEANYEVTLKWINKPS